MEKICFQPNGTEHITKAIAAACAAGERTAVITGNWEITAAVRIPSDFTLVLDGCHLRMADGVYDNLFVNEHHGTAVGKTVDGADRNIQIRGQNGAVLDGGTYNGLSERNAGKDGLPPIWKNNLLLFTNVDGFFVSGLHCRNQRWWALNFVYCRNGTVRDMAFTACDLWLDADGAVHRGLQRDCYEEILVKNADGIDLRQGCHDIVIENITGFTEDDSVALTGLNGRLEKEFAVPGLCPDIHDVCVRNIRTAAFCTNVRLLNQGDVKLYNIEIDGVYDMSETSPHMDRGIYTVRVGDTRLYGTRHATKDETYNISVKNLYSRAATAAVSLAGDMANFTTENIRCADGTAVFEDKRTK